MNPLVEALQRFERFWGVTFANGAPTIGLSSVQYLPRVLTGGTACMARSA
jgi:hypothetical protein